MKKKLLFIAARKSRTKQRCLAIEDQTTMKRDPNWVDWAKSPARGVLLADLKCRDGALCRKDHVTAEEAWEEHKHLEAFNKVVFSQFKKQLQLHREQVNREMQLSDKEELAMHHDRNLFPRQPTNKRGEKACDLHPAKDLLREIVRLNLHEGMKPSELQEATRGRPGNEFADFKPVKQGKALPGNPPQEVLQLRSPSGEEKTTAFRLEI